MTGTTRIGVDVGGTFTDLLLYDPARGLTATGKRPTTPAAPNEAITAGITRLLAETGTAPEDVAGIVHGTTLITNTVLERTGARVGLIATEGFRDSLEMGRETRFDTTDLFAAPAPVLVPRDLRLGVPGRMSAGGVELTPLDEDAVLRTVVLLADRGVEALAVALLHSYADPAHELRVRELVHQSFPELPVTLSSEVAPVIREYERTSTACMNAYVQPLVARYLDQLQTDLLDLGIGAPLRIMLSGGGVTTAAEAKAFPVRLLESGPAAGAIAAAAVARTIGADRVISFDMGGTTAKMAVVHGGQPRLAHTFEAGRVDRFKAGSGLPVTLSVVDMIEIGAGGGSIAEPDALGLLKVGPRSAGSVPGPVAYGRGGDRPTVTDADLLLGYLDPATFLGGEMPLALADVERAVGDRLAGPLGLGVTEAALGVQEVVTASMAAATRMHLAEKGEDPAGHVLIAFGGAGPVHAYGLARALKMRTVVVPMRAGVMSAYGFLVAAPEVNDVRSAPAPLSAVDWERVAGLYTDMEARAREVLESTADGTVEVVRTVDMRYVGQGFEVEVEVPAGPLSAAAEKGVDQAFADTYRAVFGRVVEGGRAEVVNWRLTARLPGSEFDLATTPTEDDPRRPSRPVHFPDHGVLDTPVFDRYALRPGTVVPGPAVFEERESSCAFGPDCTITVDRYLGLVVELG